jgi:hypothetical protein
MLGERTLWDQEMLLVDVRGGSHLNDGGNRECRADEDNQ